MARDKDTVARLQTLILRAERSLQAKLLKAIDRARSATSLKELTELIEQGRFQDAADAAGMSVARNIAASFASIYVLTGSSTSEFIETALGVDVVFNQVAPNVVNDLTAQQMRIISNMSGVQSDAVRYAIKTGMEQHLPPISIARRFRESVGMTARMQGTVDNYRRLLEEGSREALTRTLRDRRFDSGIVRAIDGEPLSKQAIDRMVKRYGERMIKSRAETIAQTETLRAVNMGNHEAYEQAIGNGVLEREQLERTWRTRGDGDVRDSHAALSGETRAVDEDFKPNLRFPGDPRAEAKETINCRCRLEVRIKQKSSDRLQITSSVV